MKAEERQDRSNAVAFTGLAYPSGPWTWAYVLRGEWSRSCTGVRFLRIELKRTFCSLIEALRIVCAQDIA